MTRLLLVAVAMFVACAGHKKAELIYEEPVTNVWTGNSPPPAQQAPPENAPAAQNPPPPAPGYGAQPQQWPPPGQAPAQATPPGYSPPAQAHPQGYPQTQAYPPASNQPQAPQLPPSPGWRNSQPAPQQGPPTDPSTATTVVVPNNDPTTQTTLKRRTGWVRGGYD